jgi:hypothetical protein
MSNAAAPSETPGAPLSAPAAGAGVVTLSDGDPGYLAAVTDLLGALAYGELRAFSQLAKDAELAPTLRHKSAIALLAAHEVSNFSKLTDRLTSLGVEPEAAMEPFVPAVDAFHERTMPSDWLEGLVKTYVGEGIAEDFYREISTYVDADTRALVLEVLDDEGQAEFAVAAVREAIAEDGRLAGRLALWGRRLVGEAITQAQRVGVERDALASILVGAPGRAGADLGELGRMFARLTDEHTRRMGRLGLSA